MKPENYKLALRRARKMAIEILELSGYFAFEATGRKREQIIIAINPNDSVSKIVHVVLSDKGIANVFDNSLPSNISQEVWLKRPFKKEFRVIF